MKTISTISTSTFTTSSRNGNGVFCFGRNIIGTGFCNKS